MQPPQAAANQIPTLPRSHRTLLARVHWLTLLLLLAASAAIRFLFLARKPFWFDECFSVEVARLDWRNFLHLLWWREANMSLYYVLLRIWLQFRTKRVLHPQPLGTDCRGHAAGNLLAGSDAL